MYYLRGDVVTDGKLCKDTFVEISGEKITYVGKEKRNAGSPVKEVDHGYICPGFIDVHIHGIDGMDFMDKEAEAFYFISTGLPKYGVTSYLATSRTASLEDTQLFLESASSHKYDLTVGAKILGVHLEGPWISPKYSGAQSKVLIRKLTWNDLENVVKPFIHIIERITIAPEVLDELSMIAHLSSHRIEVSAGHTNATIDEIGHAMEYGLKQLTHTFNAMSPLHHRTPGTTAAALYYDDLLCEIIADGVHVHPKVVELLYKVKGKEQMALISDCTGYNELPDGDYQLRGKELIRNGNEVTLKNGTLAGGAITLDKGIKYVVEHCNIPLEEAVFMATETPLLATGGVWEIGKVTTGYNADLVILDGEFNVQETIISGKSVYPKMGNNKCEQSDQ